MHSRSLCLYFKRLADLTFAGELLNRCGPALASGRIPASDLHDGPEPQLAAKGDNDEFPHDVSERIGRAQEVSLPST